MLNASHSRFLGALLFVGAASITLTSSAGAEGPSLSTRRYSLLSVELSNTPEEVDLKRVVPMRPGLVTPLDAARAQRGRVLLATGIPPLILGVFLIAWSQPAKNDNCYLYGDTMRTTLYTGVGLAAAGIGLSSGGIVALRRASKAARHAPKSRKARVTLAFAVLGSIGLSAVPFAFGIGDSVTCFSS